MASAARKAAEATARYLLSVADETTLGTFEEELVECITALLAEQGEAGAKDAPVLPVCLDCSFASGGHVHPNREDGSQAVRYPTPEEWNAALRRALLAETVATPRSMTADEGAAYGDVLDGVFKPAPPAAGDEVREAAERVRSHFKPNGYAYTPFGEDVLALLAALPAEGESAHREERVQTKIDAAVADLGNVIYNIETGEIREAMEQAREIRESLATIAEEKP